MPEFEPDLKYSVSSGPSAGQEQYQILACFQGQRSGAEQFRCFWRAMYSAGRRVRRRFPDAELSRTASFLRRPGKTGFVNAHAWVKKLRPAWKPWLVNTRILPVDGDNAVGISEANRSAFRKISFLPDFRHDRNEAVRGVEDLRTAFTRSPGSKPGQKTGYRSVAVNERVTVSAFRLRRLR
jgi:hypothetical protein